MLSTPAAGERVDASNGEGGAKKEEDGDGATWDAMEVDDDKASRGDEGGGKVAGRGGGGRWPDFPTDVALAVDRYETSKEKAYSPSELKARLASAVRRKLVLGEVGAFGTLGSSRGNESAADGERPLPWRVVLGKGGGHVRLTHGAPRTVSTAEALRQQSLAEENDSESSSSNLQQYPMEANLSVLSERPDAPWKLLSLHVRCSPKTGESDHQLVMNRKQMFDLHRIGERAMAVEEAVCRKSNERLMEDAGETGTTGGSLRERKPAVPRPLRRLFEVAHAFALSLQLEMLSSQAEALRRGAWGGSIGGGPTQRPRRRLVRERSHCRLSGVLFQGGRSDRKWRWHRRNARTHRRHGSALLGVRRPPRLSADRGPVRRWEPGRRNEEEWQRRGS